MIDITPSARAAADRPGVERGHPPGRPESAGAEPGPIAHRPRWPGTHHHRRQPVLVRLNPDASSAWRAARASIGCATSSTRRSARICPTRSGGGRGGHRACGQRQDGGCHSLVSLSAGATRATCPVRLRGAGPLQPWRSARAGDPEGAGCRRAPALPRLSAACGRRATDFVRTINQGLLRWPSPRPARSCRADRRGARVLATEGVEVETVTIQHEATCSSRADPRAHGRSRATDFAREYWPDVRARLLRALRRGLRECGRWS